MTQGFIARGADGHTVLLGRGGSDTSASYIGALLGAERVEIWTDVPGMFTTNPNDEPAARMLRRLPYDEAEALATLGARVLHPRCISPVRNADIPLELRCTYLPEMDGTVVGGPDADPTPGVKAITLRKGLMLVEMNRPPSWQPVGFVADVSACFAQHNLSIDLLSTSPQTILATLDPAAAPQACLDALLADLSEVCDAKVVRGMASVSLVGSGVRDAFDHVAPALGRLEGIDIRMVVQGANDDHLTFVIEEQAAPAVARVLHDELFGQALSEITFGPSWSELFPTHDDEAPTPTPPRARGGRQEATR